MRTEYDKNLLETIGEEFPQLKVTIHEQRDLLIDQIEAKFVMGFNGIDWSKNNILFSAKSLDQNKHLLQSEKFLKEFYKIYPHLFESKVVVFGDGLTNLGYEMNFKDFISLHEKFLSIPQHTYLWFLEEKLCANFTFENEIFFG